MAEVSGTDQRDVQRHPSQRGPKPGVVRGAEDRDLYEQGHGGLADTADPEHRDATPVPTLEVTVTAKGAPTGRLYRSPSRAASPRRSRAHSATMGNVSPRSNGCTPAKTPPPTRCWSPK